MRSSKQQPPPEAAIEIAKIAKEAGFAITAEDIQSMQSATVELSDAELEDAPGGGRRNTFGPPPEPRCN
mgnify:CR=1 FL=1